MVTLKCNYTALPRLPEDLIVEILSRLPPKYVARFKCVCKSWLSLTSDSHFIKLHISRSVENNHLNLILICYAWRMWSFLIPASTSMYRLQDKSFDEDLVVEQVSCDLFTFGSIAGSCNGLVCLIQGDDVLLLNPTTREYKLVTIDNDFGVGVNSRPYIVGATYGLGYDSVIDEYKLVQFISCRFGSPPHSKINVYSLNDSACVAISHVPYSFVDSEEWGIYLNGAVHWVATSAKTFKHQQENVIVSFDVIEKVIREFPLPDVEDKNSCATLGILRGQLCIFRNFHFEIWVMKSYGVGGTWYKLASMDKIVFGAEPLQTNFIDLELPRARLLCFSKGGGILLTYGGKLFLYDPEQKTSKHVRIHGIHADHKIITVTTPVASSVSLNSGTYLTLEHYF